MWTEANEKLSRNFGTVVCGDDGLEFVEREEMSAASSACGGLWPPEAGYEYQTGV